MERKGYTQGAPIRVVFAKPCSSIHRIPTEGKTPAELRFAKTLSAEHSEARRDTQTALAKIFATLFCEVKRMIQDHYRGHGGPIWGPRTQ